MEFLTGSNNVLVAFLLTLFAGLATGVGSLIAFFARRTNYRFLSVSLAFSAGVMLYVSFVEILGKAHAGLVPSLGEPGASWIVAGGFFGGMVFVALIDFLVPKAENPHEPREASEIALLQGPEQPGIPRLDPNRRKLMRMGLIAAFAIGVHNFPEGMATFFAALDNPSVGVAIAIAIALHNIPEGISVSVPIYYATGSRRKALVLSMLSGLCEPVGAILGFLVLRPFFTPELKAVIFAAVAGVMVFISLDELLPASREYGRGHESVYGILAGMGVMAISLILLK